MPRSTTMKSTLPKMSKFLPILFCSRVIYLHPSISSPRRIKSTTSVSTFALQLNNQTVLESHPHDVKFRYHDQKHRRLLITSLLHTSINYFQGPTKESSLDNHPDITNQRTSDCQPLFFASIVFFCETTEKVIGFDDGW